LKYLSIEGSAYAGAHASRGGLGMMITRRFKIWLVINVLALAATSAVVVKWPSLASTMTFVFLYSASGLFLMEVRQKWAIEESKRTNKPFGTVYFFSGRQYPLIAAFVLLWTLFVTLLELFYRYVAEVSFLSRLVEPLS
jgi:hypothetical protein